MKTEYHYRTASYEDLGQLIRLGLESYGRFRTVLQEAGWKKMESGLSNAGIYEHLLKQSTCFVCTAGKEVVGMAFLVPGGEATELFDKSWAHIRLLGVHPAHEGQGIGRKLTQMCIERAREAGEQVIALHTSEMQTAARHIYEGMGFKVLKEIEPRFGARYWIYVLSLNADPAGIIYYRADKNDLPTLIQYRIRFVEEFYGAQPEEVIAPLREELVRYFPAALDSNSYISYIAKVGDRVAGIGGLAVRDQPGTFANPGGRVGYICNMLTEPDFRKRGICTQILQLLIEDAKEAGITFFELHASRQGEPVYKKNGFTLHPVPTYRRDIRAGK